MFKKMKTEADISPYDMKESNSSETTKRKESSGNNDASSRDDVAREAPTQSKITYKPLSLEYDMSGNKLLFIFNHDSWKNSRWNGILPPSRPGTERDVKRLQESFGKINFIVDQPCNNFTNDEIDKKIDHICKMDHSRTSCVAIAVLTHGDNGEKVWSLDKPYPLNDIIDPLQRESKLAGIPKLFFIQTCRGARKDSGHTKNIDGGISQGSQVTTIPTHSDCLILMAAYIDHVSYRDHEEGSWMIQALCDVMDQDHLKHDILHMMMMVNNKVALRSVDLNNTDYQGMKQIPETRFTLTKSLRF